MAEPSSGGSAVSLLVALALAVVGMFLLGLLVAGWLILRAGDIPGRTRWWYRRFVASMLAQAGIGYLQYFNDLPADLVEHVLGAAVGLAVLVRTHLALTTV